MSPTVWRTVSRGWQESTSYTRPGTFAVFDSGAYPEARAPYWTGRYYVAVFHLSLEALAIGKRIGGGGLTYTVLAAADSREWVRRLARHYRNDPEALYTELWETLGDEWTAEPANVTRENLAVRLGFAVPEETE